MKESFSYISQKDDTIVAISTPLGTGGLGVVRISGKEAFSIAVLLLDVMRMHSYESSSRTGRWMITSVQEQRFWDIKRLKFD